MLIVHTTDLSRDDDIAFACALAVAVRSGARLRSIHAATGPSPARELPRAAALLSRWSSSATVDHERIVQDSGGDPSEALVQLLSQLRPDLLVAATDTRKGLERLAHDSVAETLARNVSVPSLLLPLAGTRLVDPDTGAIEMRRILVAAGSDAEAQLGVDAAAWLANMAGVLEPEIVLLHAKDARPLPNATAPGCSIVRRLSVGSVTTAIVDAAQELEPALIVMSTAGHDSPADIVLGSRTERVLHIAGRPLLSVPFPTA
jgi:nucleotide-binding universal stress UspA family protein